MIKVANSQGLHHTGPVYQVGLEHKLLVYPCDLYPITVSTTYMGIYIENSHSRDGDTKTPAVVGVLFNWQITQHLSQNSQAQWTFSFM